MTEGSNPQIRLMEAVRYALNMGGTHGDVRSLVEATLEESFDAEGGEKSRFFEGQGVEAHTQEVRNA